MAFSFLKGGFTPLSSIQDKSINVLRSSDQNRHKQGTEIIVDKQSPLYTSPKTNAEPTRYSENRRSVPRGHIQGGEYLISQSLQSENK